MIPIPIIATIIVVLYILSAIKILREYERGVIFRLGQLLPDAKGPGIILAFAPVDRVVRISPRGNSVKRGSERSGSNSGSTFTKLM